MNKKQLISSITRAELTTQLKSYKEEHDRLYKELDEIRDKFNLEMNNKQKQIKQIEEEFEALDEEFYNQYLGKYIIMYSPRCREHIKGGKITRVQSCGPGHDDCHLYGIEFTCDYGKYNPSLFIKPYDDSHEMYPSPISMYGDDVQIEILEEEDFFNRVQQYMLRSFERFKKVCRETKIGKDNEKYDIIEKY